MTEEQAQQEMPTEAKEFTSEEEEEPKKGGCCGFFHNHQILAIFIFVVLGVGLGVGLSYWEPENPNTKSVVIQWLGLVGDLFIRSLKCFVLPLVFVNIIIAVVDMMSIGKASSIGWTVIALYIITTIFAAFFGSISSLIFLRFYKTEVDVQEAGASVSEVSLSDTIYEGIFEGIVPTNIIEAFADSNFTAVLFFAGVFGAALAPEHLEKGTKLVEILQEMDRVLQRVINWIIFLTPFAVMSLITSSIGKQNDLSEAFSNIGLLMGSSFLAWGLQVVFVYMGLFAVLTKSNPLTYLKAIIPAQLFAFASASSAATIPESIKAVRASGVVPDVIGKFVIPFGATVNMDGGGVYFVCASIWLAVLNGKEVNFASFLLLIIIATLGSIGTAPVPSASLVLIITAYNTVFGGDGMPNGFGFIFAIDWFMDRMRTVCNVTGDCIVAGIVAHRNPLDDQVTGDAEKEEEAV